MTDVGETNTDVYITHWQSVRTSDQQGEGTKEHFSYIINMIVSMISTIVPLDIIT